MKALPGASTSVALTVSDADTAPALASGDMPVLATPRLLALCEEATVAAVAPFLEQEETTVGSRVELEHLAPSTPERASKPMRSSRRSPAGASPSPSPPGRQIESWGEAPWSGWWWTAFASWHRPGAPVTESRLRG